MSHLGLNATVEAMAAYNYTHSACQSSLLVVRSHAQGLDKELDRLVNAVLIIQTETPNIQGVCISWVHSQNITVHGQITWANRPKYDNSDCHLCGCTWLQTEPQGSVRAGPNILPSGSWTCDSLVRTPRPGPCRKQPGNHPQLFLDACVEEPILITIHFTILKSLFSNPISASLSYSRMDSEFFSWKQMLKKGLFAFSSKS